jgi:hypothetical protein
MCSYTHTVFDPFIQLFSIYIIAVDFLVDQVRKKAAENPLAKIDWEIYQLRKQVGGHCWGKLTPLIISELHVCLFIVRQLISIRFGVKAVQWLQGDSQVARARVNSAPRGDGVQRVDLGLDVIEMPLAKTPNRAALVLDVRIVSLVVVILGVSP